ncbi:MAG TPA: hypothetical protein VEO91_09435 [Candidatus Limnocylindria bacterium]|nr:hypothetical protein [Candidatus Limnocylindria bacterium]
MMEALAALFGGISLLVLFDALAIRFGADSRDPIGDDHRRGTTVTP